jgi:hypothetical protein
MQEYWWLDETAGSVNAKVSLYWEDATAEGINDCVDLDIATWDVTNYWVEESSTYDAGSTCSGAGTGSITSNTNSSTFNKPYTFASKSSTLNPLPIELVSFTATPVQNNVSLNWVTASETNNAFFTIQKTTNGIHYDDVVTVPGAGTSSQQNFYSALDETPFTGQSYYRLKQTDYNGQESYSSLVPIFFDASSSNEVLVFPNPGNPSDQINVKIFGFESASQLEVFNVEGQKVFATDLNTDNAIYNYQLPGFSLAPGFYMVKVSDGMKTVAKKFQVL